MTAHEILPLNTLLRVQVRKGDDCATIVTSQAWLDDVIPDDDDRWFVAQAIHRHGFAFVGGGAAPLFYIVKL